MVGWEQTLTSLKVFGMCWRRLYRVLDSCIVNTRSWPKLDAPLDGNKCFDVYHYYYNKFYAIFIDQEWKFIQLLYWFSKKKSDYAFCLCLNCIALHAFQSMPIPDSQGVLKWMRIISELVLARLWPIGRNDPSKGSTGERSEVKASSLWFSGTLKGRGRDRSVLKAVTPLCNLLQWEASQTMNNEGLLASEMEQAKQNTKHSSKIAVITNKAVYFSTECYCVQTTSQVFGKGDCSWENFTSLWPL